MVKLVQVEPWSQTMHREVEKRLAREFRNRYER